MNKSNQMFYSQVIECILTGFMLNLAFVVACKLLYNTYFPIGKANQIILCAVVTCIGILILAFDKYFSVREKAFAVMIPKMIAVIAIMDFIFVSLLYFNLSVRLSLYLFILTNVMQVTLLLMLKLMFRQYKKELVEESKTLVISADGADSRILEMVLGQGAKNVAFICLDKNFGKKADSRIGNNFDGQSVISMQASRFGARADKQFDNDFDERLVSSIQTADVIYLSDKLSKEQKDKIVSYCIFKDKNVYLVPETYEIALRKSELTQVGDVPVFNISSFRFTQMQLFMKRVLDIIGSFVGLIVLGPVCIAAMILIRREDGGPVFFSQTRAGKGGKEFKVIKLRTMIPDAEKHTGAVLAKESDPRITRIGKSLRSMRIDEIPQFLNVLKGEMSLVGPRPERPVFVEEYSKSSPEYASRLMVKPGITGMAQVMGSYRTTADSKAKFDLVYIRNYSFWLDIKILLKTVGVVFVKDRAQGVRAEIGKSTDNVGDSVYSGVEVSARFVEHAVGETPTGIGIGFGMAERAADMRVDENELWQIPKPVKRKTKLLYKLIKTTAAVACILVIMSGIVVLRYSNLVLNVMAEEARAVSALAVTEAEGTTLTGDSELIASEVGISTASSDNMGEALPDRAGVGSVDGTDLNWGSSNELSASWMERYMAELDSADSMGTYKLAAVSRDADLAGAVDFSKTAGISEFADSSKPGRLSEQDTQKKKEPTPAHFNNKVNVMYKLITKMSTEDIFIIEDMSEGGFTEVEKEAVKQILRKYFNQDEIGYVLEVYRQVVR